MLSRAALLNREFETLLCDANQRQPAITYIPDRNSCRRITNKPIQGDSTIDGKYIAFFQLVVARKTMNNLLVNRSTDGIGKAVIALESRQAAGSADHLLCCLIDFDGRNAGFDQSFEFLKHESGKLARRSHLFDLFF